MKAVALQANDKSAPPRKQQGSSLSLHLSPWIAQPGSGISGAVLQRKSDCACGGGCPSCAEPTNPGIIQTKLTVSTPGYQYEQEADQVAQEVIRMPEASGARVKSSGVPTVARRSRGSSPSPGNSPPINEVLRSPGQQLDSSTRDFMESRFGHDFASVRVHDDRQAMASASGVSARAYTVGDHIVFGAGEYRPQTNDGRRLLAHELAHTLQAGAGVVRRSVISDNIQAVWDATPTLDALLARLSRVDVQGAQSDADIDSKIATLLAGRAGDLWVAQRIRQGRLGTTAGARPVEAHFIQGTTNQRALVIAGVHGSEGQGIEVARMLLADVAAHQPMYTVIVVPSLFPDNAATGSRERATPTNRNLPPANEDVAAATAAGRGMPVDATTNRRGVRTRAILPENIMLLQLIERFSPERIISIHGTRHSGAGGVFYDPVSLSPAEIALAHLVAKGMTYLQVTVEELSSFAGQLRFRLAEERNFQLAMAAMQHRDSATALAAAAQIDAATTGITGRERRRLERETESTVDPAELARRRAHPSVPGNVGPSGNVDTAFWSGSVPGGVSLGGYASQRGISIFTVEPPLNLRTTDYPSPALDAQVEVAERRVELQAYADAVRTVLLGR